MLANSLVEKLKTLSLTGSPVIKTGALAATHEIGVLVKSPLDGMKVDPEMPGYVTGAIQIVVRHKDPIAGDALAKEISTKLTVKGTPMPLTGYTLKCFYPMSEPIMFPPNDAALFEFSVTFQCHATSG
jgi:hypothetical protein